MPFVAEAGASNTDHLRTIRVLCVDYSIGFGGATKSMSLMLRDVPGLIPTVVTAQTSDLRQLWYGAWRCYSFRGLVNYRTRRFVEQWMDAIHAPGLLRTLATKSLAALYSLASLGNTVRLAWLIRRNGAELVHLANGFGPPEALRAARLAGVPAIAHLRGFFRFRGPLPKRVWAPPTLVIGDSDAVTRSFLEGVPSSVPATTLLEVVDVPRFDATAHRRDETRAHWALKPHNVAVGIFGRVIPWKGQKEFVLAMLKAMDTDQNLVGVLIGDASDGTSNYMDEVQALIDESGKADRFRLTGYIEDVEPLYGAMDIVVHASIEPEPCGMVVMEAMAARRPVIAADAGGPRELVRENVDGHLVTPGDVPALSAAILDLADDEHKRSRMGEAGYHRARELFDVPIAAARLRWIYERLTDGNRVAAGDWLPDWVSATTSP